MAQGRGSACWRWGLVALVGVASLLHMADAVDHVVGGSYTWKAPGLTNVLNSTYLQDWASTQSFSTGDNLVFTYSNLFHNVLEVDSASYSSCNTQNYANKYESGNDTITLKKSGMNYYTCGFSTHCTRGQRLAVNASGPSMSSTNAGVCSSVTVLEVAVACALAVICTVFLW